MLAQVTVLVLADLVVVVGFAPCTCGGFLPSIDAHTPLVHWLQLAFMFSHCHNNSNCTLATCTLWQLYIFIYLCQIYIFIYCAHLNSHFHGHDTQLPLTSGGLGVVLASPPLYDSCRSQKQNTDISLNPALHPFNQKVCVCVHVPQTRLRAEKTLACGRGKCLPNG